MLRYEPKVLKRMRAERGWTLAEVSKRAHIAPRTVLYVERGHAQPKANTLAALAHAFGVPMETFFAERPRRRKAAAPPTDVAEQVRKAG